MLESVPRITPKNAYVKPGVKYLNMEEKIQEYLSRYMSKDLCFLFKPDPMNQDDMLNNTKNIIAKIACVRDNDILVEVVDKKYFEKNKGKIKARIISICNQTEEGLIVDKIIRFEAKIVE